MYAECLNKPGYVTCECMKGFAGSGNGSNGCQDVNECLQNNGGCGLKKCLNYQGGRECKIDSPEPTVTILEISKSLSVIATSEYLVMAKFHCLARGYPTRPSIEWRKDFITLPQPHMNVSTKTNGNMVSSQLTIRYVEVSDAGQYRCVASNEKVQRFNDTTLNVIQDLVFEERPKNVTVTTGGNVTLKCKVKAENELNVNITWSFEGKIIHNNTGKERSLPLRIDNASPSDVGEYICRARTTFSDQSKGTGVIQDKLSRAFLTVQSDPCIEEPCLYGGSCKTREVADIRDFECQCPKGYYGKNCQLFDRAVFGVRGITVFDSEIQGPFLDITCEFGPLVAKYAIYQLFQNDTKILVSQSYHFSKTLIAPDRENKNNEETDDLSFLVCDAEIDGANVTDKKQIRFSNFVDYGDSAQYNSSLRNTNSQWYINGNLEQNSSILEKRWFEPPGSTHRVEVREQSGSKLQSWDVIICGYNLEQVAIVYLVCVMIILVFSLTLALMVCCKKKEPKNKERNQREGIIAKCKTNLRRCRTKRITSKKDKGESFFSRAFKRVKSVQTFVSEFRAFEILVGIGYFFRQDNWWASITFVIIGAAWLFRFLSFLRILLREQGNKLKIFILALLNQVEPLLEDCEAEDFQPSPEIERKKSTLHFCRWVSSAEKFALLVLQAIVLTELLGNTHMCFPPSVVFNQPNTTHFNDAPFVRYSLSSIQSNKKSILMDTVIRDKDKDADSFMKRFQRDFLKFSSMSDFAGKLGICKKKEPCRCKKWEAKIGDCLPARLLDQALIKSGIQCFVIDCYQSACLFSLIIPLAQFLKSTIGLSWTLTKKLNPAPVVKPFLAIRFLYINWSLVGLLYITLYASEMLEGLYQDPMFKGIVGLVTLVIFRLLTPLKVAQWSNHKFQRICFVCWFCCGAVQSLLFLSLL